MKKLMLSIMSVVVVSGLVAGSAVALFSDTVTLTGVTFSAGTVDLEISVDGGASYNTTQLDGTAIWDQLNLIPGDSGSEIAVPGSSGLAINNAGTVDLDITMAVTSSDNDFDSWKGFVEVAVVPNGSTAPTRTSLGNSDDDYYTLEELNTTPVAFDSLLGDDPSTGGTDESQSEVYDFYWVLDSTAPNTIAGSDIDVEFVFEGTQVGP